MPDRSDNRSSAGKQRRNVSSRLQGKLKQADICSRKERPFHRKRDARWGGLGAGQAAEPARARVSSGRNPRQWLKSPPNPRATPHAPPRSSSDPHQRGMRKALNSHTTVVWFRRASWKTRSQTRHHHGRGRTREGFACSGSGGLEPVGLVNCSRKTGVACSGRARSRGRMGGRARPIDRHRARGGAAAVGRANSSCVFLETSNETGPCRGAAGAKSPQDSLLRPVVYDAGILIAADRNDRSIWAEHRVYLEAGLVPLVPSPVVAQVSRSPKQAQLRRVLRGCEVISFQEGDAHEAGHLLARSKTRDIVDAAVVVLALARGAEIRTMDTEDIEHLLEAAASEGAGRPST